MKNTLIAVLGFVALGLSIALAQRRKREELPGMPQDLPNFGQPPTDEDVKRFIEAGEKITAIKLYREIHGGGLKEAKDAVHKIAREQGGSSR